MFYGWSLAQALPVPVSRAYYINEAGNDAGTGDKNNPFKTIAMINTIKLHAGDSVLLKGGQIFKGTLQINAAETGSLKKLIYISSIGKGFAIIDGENNGAVVIERSKNIQLKNIIIKGAGRKDGNVSNGVLLKNCNNISIDSLTISGFQKAGLMAYNSSLIRITNVQARENGFAGISIEGEFQKTKSHDIYIANCLAENNPGDPSNLKNHSGNGIIIGNSRNITVEYCVATNNGWDMPRIGNGPVGIWCYESSKINIQYCISYNNKTAKGADDGGGFDFDGGVTYSVIEHCLSYNNEGSGFGIFQYANASPWHHNIIRNNISENDGAVSAAQANVYVWNSTGDADQFTNLSFYNNIVYNEKGAAIHYAGTQSKRKGFSFYKNIFVAKDEIINGKVARDVFSGNTWWSIADSFNIDNTKDYKTWAIKTGKEQKNKKVIGKNKKSYFNNAGNTTLTDPHQLQSFIQNYQRAR